MTEQHRIPVQARGQQKRASILDAAQGLLIEDGYAALSMRRVASRVGISLGNLQHYFPSKRSLLAAILDLIEGELRTEFQSRATTGLSPTERLLAGVDTLLDHIATPQGSVTVWDLWALAGHDEQARDIMDAGYTRLRQSIEEMVAAISPGMDSARRATSAAAIVSTIEGSSLFIGHGKRRHDDLSGLRDHIREGALRIARDK